MSMYDPESSMGRAAAGLSSGHYKALAKTACVDQLAEHMADISDDPSGSDPRNYVSARDVERLEEFREWAADEPEHGGWPGSVELSMQKYWIPGIPAWTNGLNYAKHYLTKKLLFRRIGDSHQGYKFGFLNVPLGHKILVAYCDDGLFRQQRGRELPVSDAVGWGRLPDPEYLEGNLTKGSRFAVEYREEDIGHALLARVPVTALPDPNRRATYLAPPY